MGRRKRRRLTSTCGSAVRQISSWNTEHVADDADIDIDDATLDDSELPSEDDDQLSEESGELSAADVEPLVLYTLDWSVQSLLERIGSTFDISPAFQRRDAWDRTRKSLYIESLMAGLPVPQIVLAEDRELRGRFIVLDGKQRLVTMKQFASPSLTFPSFRLRGLQFLPELDGKTFDEIFSSMETSEYAEAFLAQPVRTIVVRNWKRVEVLYHIFVRLNQGSVSLSPQELRQALFPGQFTRWIDERSAKSTPIQGARRLKREDFRMRDAEMLLRYVALEDSLETYGGNLRSFLDDACATGNKKWPTRADHYAALADRCEQSIGSVFEVFGENSFLRFDGERYVRRFNIAVFDAMTVVFSDPAVAAIHPLPAAELQAAYERLSIENETFHRSLISTTKTTSATLGRILWLAEAVGAVLGVKPAVIDRIDQSKVN